MYNPLNSPVYNQLAREAHRGQNSFGCQTIWCSISFANPWGFDIFFASIVFQILHRSLQILREFFLILRSLPLWDLFSLPLQMVFARASLLDPERQTCVPLACCKEIVSNCEEGQVHVYPILDFLAPEAGRTMDESNFQRDDSDSFTWFDSGTFLNMTRSRKSWPVSELSV